MKLKKQNIARKYISLFCGCIITVVLSSAVIINKNNNNYIKQFKNETTQVNYSFGNVYTYDEVPKYIATVPELTISAKEQNLKEKLAYIENENQLKAEEERLKKEQEEQRLKEEQSKVVYDNMTLVQLTEKIDKSLNSTVAGYGNLFASYSLERGVDPYIATAIMLHETGCKWQCSELVVKCNNVGGIKGSPSCGNGSYKSYPTLEDGIKSYIDNLSNGYFLQGLNTPETIAKKYTGYENSNWTEKVNNYINSIKAQ